MTGSYLLADTWGPQLLSSVSDEALLTTALPFGAQADALCWSDAMRVLCSFGVETVRRSGVLVECAAMIVRATAEVVVS